MTDPSCVVRAGEKHGVKMCQNYMEMTGTEELCVFFQWADCTGCET